jgi:mannose-1-phosphate guanylyltransferase
LAAGAGTRLRPLTRQLPKPLLAPAGRPLVDLAVEALDRAGAVQVVVNTHHGARQLGDHLGGRPGRHLLHEPKLLGTGGGLANAYHRGLLGRGTVLVTAADVLVHPGDLARLAALLDRTGATAAIGLVPAEPGLLGIRLDGHHAAAEEAGAWSPAAVHALRAAALEPVPPRPANLVDAVLVPLWRRGEVAGIPLEHPWVDAGTLHRFLAASAGLLRGAWPYRLPPGRLQRGGGHGPVFLGDDAAAEATALLAGPVVLDTGSRIGADAVVTRTVVGPGATVGDGAVVTGSILGPGATVPPGARVVAALLPGPLSIRGYRFAP